MSLTSVGRKSSDAAPMSMSQVPGAPTFRSSAINAVAVIPLLSSDRNGHDDNSTFSSRSFQDLMTLLQRYNRYSTDNTSTCNIGTESLVLVVPHSNLTQPGEFKYNLTPLRNFHWRQGCQRLQFFDGRPYNSRMAHDRLINHQLTRDWIDLCPSRRTAALIGVLNVRDCSDEDTLNRAVQEWQQWAERYSTPPYEVTAHGRDFERDFVVQRLFVFDSFHDGNKVDLNAQTKALGSNLVAFPPGTESDSVEMMDLHINVVINDLAVAIFRDLEGKIKASDAIVQGTEGQPLSQSSSKSRFSLGLIKSSSADSQKDEKEEDSPVGSTDLSINNLASVVSPNSKLASPPKDTKTKRPSSTSSIKYQNVIKGSSSEAQLLTPLDEFWDYSELAPKDAHEMMKREVARREKFAADLSLLAGCPLDAYERYTKAADFCKTTCPDPLWYASALEGCAAAHIAMADVGGYSVDDYLETSFQLPDEIMTCAVVPATDKSTNKQNLPRIVFALCDDALDVTSRHPKLSGFHAELLLKLAWYAAELEDAHERCLWGLGEGCYGGEAGNDKSRWEMASATQLNFLELKNKDGEDIIRKNNLQRCRKWIKYLHSAASTGALDPISRVDVSLRCATICLKGLRPTLKPTMQQRSEERIQFRRKAAFFMVAAAEAMCDVDPGTPNNRANTLWMQASKMLSQTGNGLLTGSYGWANLRAVALHAIVMQGLRETSDVAAIHLLSLMSEIVPEKYGKADLKALSLESLRDVGDDSNAMDISGRSDSYVDNQSYSIAEARSYVREKAKEVAKDARARSKELFSGQNAPSSLLIVAQSKWVDDDPITPTMLPMEEFSSDFANKILSLRAVWAAIKFDKCSVAQRRLIGQISDLRKSSPASSLPNLAAARQRGNLPIKINAVEIAESDSSTRFERVKTKKNETETSSAMATFFNPYENKKNQEQSTIIALREEQYVSVTFENHLSIPFDVASCKLEFDVKNSDVIKAPAISFVIPGQTKTFLVKFPFIVLENPKDDDSEDISISIKGIHVTTLSRSIYLKLAVENESKEIAEKKITVIPPPLSNYPRRDYKSSLNFKREIAITSPVLEIVPPQPILQVSFATSPTPIDEETIIPVPIADGEVFTLPRLSVWNDPGQGGFGKVEELRISAIGLPGTSEVVLFDLSKSNEGDTKLVDASGVIVIKANCIGIDKDSLNGCRRSCSSYLSLKLHAGANLGSVSSGCAVTIRIRYRGKPASPSFEVWRKRDVEVRILRIKGPRISSLSFRCDLFWQAAYTDICRSFSFQDSHRFHTRATNEMDLPAVGSTDDDEFVANRLGMDSGVHVCSDDVAVILSVANETAAPIMLSKLDGSCIGLEGSTLTSISVQPGVSVKIPMILPRILRTTELCGQVTRMTQLKWRADTTNLDGYGDETSGGPMIPINRRVREGIVEIPSICLKNIVDENPVFLSRICKSPCMITVNAIGNGGTKAVSKTEKGKPVDLSVEVEIASWLSEKLLHETSLRLEFCCAKRGTADGAEDGRREYVWIGQIRKALIPGKASFENPHLARLLFLNEGTYAVSACVIFSRKEAEENVKEVWWAEKAATIHVTHRNCQ